ncbi:MAG: hypothetical protein E7269_06080 [Lachnospiraceae bacterium]|nr:hypothetical protein [Lachnospiraceae bacterium]
METKKRIMEVGFDVTGDWVNASYIILEEGILENFPGQQVSKEQWKRFLSAPKKEDGPIRDLLYQMQEQSGCDEIHGLLITMEGLTEEHIIEVMAAAETIGFDKHHLRIISPGESILHYIIHQKKEIWSSAVIVFDFKGEQFMMRKMTTSGLRLPKQLKITEKDLSGTFTEEQLATEEGRMEADQAFLTCIQEEFRRTAVSGVILVGKVFELQWMKQSLNFLCERRRVFLGNNIYAEGSCYAAMRLYQKQDPGDFYFDCEGRTKINIDLAIVHHKKQALICLSKAGTYWYKASVQIQVLLGRDKELKFVLTDPVSKETKTLFIELEGLPKRPEKTTRVDIRVMCYGDRSYEFIATDLGFGDFFESSGVCVKKKVMLTRRGMEEGEE